MVVCHHYQRGNCRFGASCRYEHSDANYDSYYHTNESSRFTGDRYHYVKPTVPTTQPVKNDTSQIFDVVAADTMVAVRGKQWPFSSYGPVKGCQNIIGLEDISPEEFRYIMYSAKETGNVEECKRHWNEQLEIENMKRTVLMTPSVEADAAIQSIYRTEDQQSSIQSGPFQTSQPALNRTAAESHTASIFGGSSSFAAPFSAGGNTANTFGNTSSVSTNNPFGTTHFGTGNTANAFDSGNSSIFGGSAASAQPVPSGLFSAAAAAVSQQTGGFFGSPVAQPAVPAQTGGFFGVTPVQPPSGLFASAAFGDQNAARPSNTFGGSWTAQPSVFGASSHTASIFGGQKQTLPPSFESVQGNQAFGKTQAPSGMFNQTQEVIGTDYTSLSELDDEEKEAFQAKKFTLGKIPIRPPPRELCF